MRTFKCSKLCMRTHKSGRLLPIQSRAFSQNGLPSSSEQWLWASCVGAGLRAGRAAVAGEPPWRTQEPGSCGQGLRRWMTLVGAATNGMQARAMAHWVRRIGALPWPLLSLRLAAARLRRRAEASPWPLADHAAWPSEQEPREVVGRRMEGGRRKWGDGAPNGTDEGETCVGGGFGEEEQEWADWWVGSMRRTSVAAQRSRNCWPRDARRAWLAG
jgi:hypothetical protein